MKPFAPFATRARHCRSLWIDILADRVHVVINVQLLNLKLHQNAHSIIFYLAYDCLYYYYDYYLNCQCIFFVYFFFVNETSRRSLKWNLLLFKLYWNNNSWMFQRRISIRNSNYRSIIILIEPTERSFCSGMKQTRNNRSTTHELYRPSNELRIKAGELNETFISRTRPHSTFHDFQSVISKFFFF